MATCLVFVFASLSLTCVGFGMWLSDYRRLGGGGR